MNTNNLLQGITGCAVAVLALIASTAALAEEEIQWVTTARGRYEIAIGVQSWPAIADLQPATGGSFDQVGVNLSVAGHWPVRRFADSELLVGADLGLFSNESDIRFTSDELIARNGYITPSVKWMFGRRHRYSLDGGIGYYMLDIAEVAGAYPAYIETQLWEESAVGGYIGATIDFRGGEPSRNHGVMLTFKTHFVNFDNVRDEDPFLPVTLGPNAGDISGPVYMLQIGYRYR